ncbi:hypothetical protein ACN4EE_05400 [Geminocystis sp. CENA526]|uniref:hypothetical protein n=1 Tax=Geminocystis sp. CENA526 TaxID=1355871 RepID=UPI003D6F71A4
MKTIDRNFRQKFLSFLLQRKANHQEGYVLVLAIGVVVGLAGLVALYARTSRVEKYSNTATVDSNSGFYGAEAGLNLRANKLREVYLNSEQPKGTSPTSTTACFDDDTTNDGTLDFKCDRFEVPSADPRRGSGSVTTYVVPINNGEGSIGVVPRGNAFQGLNMVEYGHSIFSLAFKDNNEATAQGKQAVAILQMDVKSRLIPMFQFAAFYTGDLEILPGPNMTLSGPVHTNGDLYLGSDNTLRIRGQVTTVRDIFNRRKNNNTTYPDGRVQIDNSVATALNLLFNGTGSTTQTTNAMDPTRIRTAWGTQVQVRTEAPVSIPTPSILTTSGDYYINADIRIKFKPQATATNGNFNYLKNNIPFEVTAIDRTSSTGQALSSPVTRNFTNQQLASFYQPVMVGADLAAIPSTSPYHICTPATLSGSLATWWNGLTAVQKNNFREEAQKYIQEQIQSQDAPLRFSFMSLPIKNVRNQNTNLYGSFATNTAQLRQNSKLQQAFTNQSERNQATNNLDDMTAQQIAGLSQYDASNNPIPNTARCFIGAPITEIGRDNANHLSFYRFFNNRENRDMRLLQLNIQSMAVWNRDGVHLTTGNNLASANGLLYIKAPADNNAPEHSFQRLGLAAIDNSQGGMVLHATIDGVTYLNAATNASRYGFAVIKGQQLFGLAETATYPDPTGLTIATDQAIYPQGDYNNVNKQPASFLADTFNPLSNACIIVADSAINRANNANCNQLNGDAITPTATVFNAAVLAGTDVTNGTSYNGGLENYPRFLENWGGTLWQYRGSFVSISTPLRSNGNWSHGGNIYTAPQRDWDYDQDFNNPLNLPPLTPQFVSLTQESFIRSFEQ